MRRQRPLLGTFVEIDAEGLPRFELERAVEAAFATVALVGRLMSFHDPDSDLSGINRGAAVAPVAVHPWTARVISRALALHRVTDGLFDCAIACELVRWKLLPDHGPMTAPATMAAVRLLPDNHVVFDTPLALDLGGVAKGFAVDRAVAVLRRHGVRAAVVNAGGDLRAIGPAIPIHLRDPVDPPAVRFAGMLQNGAIATSSAAATLTRFGSGQVSALVRARTRRPIIDRDAFSVIAGSCIVADALTKVLAQLRQPDAPCFRRLGAVCFITPSLAPQPFTGMDHGMADPYFSNAPAKRA
jgi:thiamine biosynthesis lipoprotein